LEASRTIDHSFGHFDDGEEKLFRAENYCEYYVIGSVGKVTVIQISYESGLPSICFRIPGGLIEKSGDRLGRRIRSIGPVDYFVKAFLQPSR
jgi:hypothetical protein